MTDLVSVIIPTYNRAAFISESINSVLKQTYDELECIVIDGGSDDGTRELLADFEDDRLQLHFRDGPLGIANARNFGIQSSQGNYIVFLDDDDRMYPNAVETLLDTIDTRPLECAGVFTAQRIVSESGDTQVKEVPQGRIEEFEEVSVSGFSCTLIKREVFEQIGYIDESFPACEDSDLWIRILSKFFMVGLNKVLYDRMVHDNQTIRDDEKMVEGKRRLLEKHNATLSNSYKITQRRAIFRSLLRLERFGEARSELRTLMREDRLRKHYLYYYFWLLLGASGYKIGRRLHHDVYNSLD